MGELVCIVCPNSCNLSIEMNQAGQLEVQGAKCKKGIDFAQEEILCPKRSVCTTVKTISKIYPTLPVRTEQEVPKSMIHQVMRALGSVIIDYPVRRGDIIVQNVAGTGVDVIATTFMDL